MSILKETPPVDRICVTHEGKDYEHIIEGKLFRKKTRESEKTGKVTVIYDALREDEIKACVRALYHDETGTREYNYTLVRRTIGDQWVYYPLPLIFSPLTQRVLAGKQTGTKVPCARWVRRTRAQIYDYLESLQAQ